MDHALEHHPKYLGKHISALPTPSLVVSLPVVRRNIAALHRDVEALGVRFRPHVKTLKTLEITRMMLGQGKYRSIVASTLSEIRGLLPLVKEGLLDECVYGIPIYPGVLPQLLELRQSLKVILMVDNEQQISMLESFVGPASSDQPAVWDVFVKLDVGSRRAGIPCGSDGMRSLISRAEASPAVRIYGIYCHAGHSYAGATHSDAETVLSIEVNSVLEAAALLSTSGRQIVVSVGATPTAHVVSRLMKSSIPQNVVLELHAGNFPTNDLQQVSTGLVALEDQAVRINVEVCGVYPGERNEALVNAGAIALSRETAHGFPGFGRIVADEDWAVVRLSQEHGILGHVGKGTRQADEKFKLGDRLQLYCNHSCITAAAFFVYFAVDENDVVQETWTPWKGW